ncbi:MAG: DUF1698 domain-containing protein [Bradymonadales bacterium]|nr:DUF1698 domain-containing protein [Bradymonadales bacterium]
MIPIDQEMRQRIEKMRWYHEFDLGEGLVTRPEAPYRDIWRMIETFLAQVDFAGKTVLDVGCWDGYWSFYAERRGARSVLAVDVADQRWGGWECFQVVHQLWESRVESRQDISIYDLASLGSRFDIVLLLGVYYHLTHPNYGFTQVRHVLEPGGTAVIEGGVINDSRRSYLQFYYGPQGDEPYRTDPSNWNVPTRRCLRDMVQANYLEILAEEYLLQAPADLTPDRNELGRAILLARAVERSDSNYHYRPLLGLHRYDPRFSSP